MAASVSLQTSTPIPTPTPTTPTPIPPTLPPPPTSTETETATATVTATPIPSPTSNSDSGDSGSLMWLWLALIVLGVALVITFAVLAERRSKAREWHDSADRTMRSIRWVNDTYVPQLLAVGSGLEMQQTWPAGQAQISHLDAELVGLQSQAKGTDQVTAVQTVRNCLASLGQAVNQTVSLAASGQSPDLQRQALASVQQARSALGASLSGVLALRPKS